MKINQNKLVWVAVVVLLVMQIFVLYQLMQQSNQAAEFGVSSVPVADSRNSVDSTTSNITEKTPQQIAMDTSIAGSGIMYVQGSVNSYTDGLLSFTTTDGYKAQASVSASTEVITIGEPKPRSQLKSETNEYIRQLEALRAGDTQNAAKIDLFESPMPFIKIVLQPNDLKPGDNISVVYVATKSDGSYDAFRVVLLPARN